MAENRFDIQFAGELVPGADPLTVRGHLRDLFKLSPEALERLFDGRAVIVKRDLEPAMAARYRDAFRDAGAVLHLVPHPAAANPDVAAQPAAPDQGRPTDPHWAGAGLTLAPLGADVGEAVVSFPPRDIETSHLSLVAGWGWTLEDCFPAPIPTPIPDLSHLSLAPLDLGFRRDGGDLNE